MLLQSRHLKYCLLFAALGLSLWQSPKGFAEAPGVQTDFPVIELQPLYGGEIASITIEGQLTYVDVWASWCSPCARTLPELQKLSKEYAPDEVRFVMVSVDENPDQARAFAHRIGVKEDQFSDPEGMLMTTLGVEGLPTGFLVDAKGNIRLVHVGGPPGATDFLRTRIDQLLAEQRFQAAMNKVEN
ncbi:MAG: hypothetical protein Hens3KO_09190 [Henriciella sp.]